MTIEADRIEADRNLIAVMTSRLKHGTSVLQGDARWAYTAAVERVLADHARLRMIVGDGDGSEVIAAAFELLDAQDSSERHTETGSKRYTSAWGALRRAGRKARA